MPRKSSTHNKKRFILWNALFLLGAGLMLSIVWMLLVETLLLPFALANMVSGFLAGSLLAIAQQIISTRMQREMLPYWIFSSALGGILGGLAAGAGHIFLQGLFSAPLPQAAPLVGVFVFIGLMQADSLPQYIRQVRYWPLLMGALGLATGQGNPIISIIASVIVALIAAVLLERWQPVAEEQRPRSIFRQQPSTERLRLPEANDIAFTQQTEQHHWLHSSADS